MGLARIVGQRSSDQSGVMTWLLEGFYTETADLTLPEPDTYNTLSNHEEWKKWFSKIYSVYSGKKQTVTLFGLTDGTFHFRLIAAGAILEIDETGLYNLKYSYSDIKDGTSVEICGDFNVCKDEEYKRSFVITADVLYNLVLQVWK